MAKTSTYGDYITFPMVQEHKNAAGRVIGYRKFSDFQELICCPEKGVIINQDGRNRTDLKYILDMKTTPIEDEWDQFINSIMPD